MLILLVAMVIRNELLMLLLMLLLDNIFFYILTIKKLFASLSFITKQYKSQKSGFKVPKMEVWQTCLYGSHMGYIYGTHMGSATEFSMGPIWVSPYAGCPDGPHITVP